ncbi:hypothetical protein, partial [Brevundimonas sp. Root1423]
SDVGAALFSVITLVLSLIVAVLKYESRSRDLFHSFRAIQKVSSEAEVWQVRGGKLATQHDCLNLNASYQDALDKSENHTPLDFYRAMTIREGDNEARDRKLQNEARFRQGLLTALPILITLASLLWLGKIALDLLR